jgi:hypothetical protein
MHLGAALNRENTNISSICNRTEPKRNTNSLPSIKFEYNSEELFHYIQQSRTEKSINHSRLFQIRTIYENLTF